MEKPKGDALEESQRQYERKKEREQKIHRFSSRISQQNMLDEEQGENMSRQSSLRSCSSQTIQTTSIHKGALESARKFLFEEDDDDDNKKEVAGLATSPTGVSTSVPKPSPVKKRFISIPLESLVFRRTDPTQNVPPPHAFHSTGHGYHDADPPIDDDEHYHSSIMFDSSRRLVRKSIKGGDNEGKNKFLLFGLNRTVTCRIVFTLAGMGFIALILALLLQNNSSTPTATASLIPLSSEVNSTNVPSTIAAAAAGSVLSDANKNSDANSQQADDLLPIVNQERYDELSSFLADFSISDDNSNAIVTPGTAQNSALRWLVDYDEAQLEFDKIGEIRIILERYALAVLYSSTYGYTENHPCHDDDENNNNNNCRDTWFHSTHWMSSLSVCSWYGVKCDRFRRVQQLDLKSNGIRGFLPAYELALLSHCESIDLSQNQLMGEIPTSLVSMPFLYGLFLEDNQLTGKVPSEFGQSILQELYVGTNHLTGEIPQNLPPTLHGLGFEENLLTGTIPTSLFDGTFPQLRTLYLDGNTLTGSLPNVHQNGRTPLALQDLRLRQNQLTGTLPASLFQKMTSLELLYLDRNQFEGELFSTAWRSLSLLQELHLYQNKLRGPIPPEFISPSMDQLTILYLDDNQFTGTIPDPKRLSPSSNLSLQTWYIFGNELVGPLPKHTLSALQHTLQAFQYQDNQITGTIPTEVGLLSELQTLVGGLNSLRGPIPTELGQLKKLKTMNLTNNPLLQGDFPNDELCFLPKLEMIDVDCGANGTITNCKCCRNCPF